MDKLESVRVKETNQVVLQPHQLKNVSNHVQKAALALLFTYKVCEVPSIIIAINRIQINDDLIQTFDDQSQMMLDIEYSVTYLQFRPGAFVKGILVQQFSSHIIVQLYGLFNVVIQADEISKNIVWNDEFASYMYSKTNEVISIGSGFQIQILQLDGSEVDNKQFNIQGSLKDRKLTGPIQYVSQQVEENEKVNNMIYKSQQILQ